MLEFIQNVSNNPFALVALLILSSWIWEDASVVTGALLAADGFLSVPVAVIAVFVGITSGDLALYYLGRLAIRWRPLRYKLVTNAKYREFKKRFKRRLYSNIFVIRFVPGLRTLGFTLCGLWKIPHIRFISAMASAGIFWILIVFTAVYSLGSSEWLEESRWKYGLIVFAFIMLVVNNYLASRRKGA